MMFRKSLVLILVLAVFGHPAVLHADEPKPQVQISAIGTDEWPTIQATVTVLDGTGQPIAGLTAESFSARLGDASLPITGEATTSDPGLGIAVVLAFDTSGSMAGSPLDEAKSAGKALLEQLGPEDTAAVLSFSDNVSLVQGFTADRALLTSAIDRLSAQGNTALFSAVAKSVELSAQAPSPRRAVVLLSDGHDFGGISGVDGASTIVSVANGGVLFFTVGLGADIDQGYLTQLAQAGHAQFLSAPAPEDLRGLYVNAGNVLRQQYVLTLDASHAEVPAGAASLQITARAGTVEGTGQGQVMVPAAANVPSLAPATASPPAQQAPVQGQSSSFPWLVAAGAAALVLGGAGGVLALSRRRRVAVAENDAPVERLMREPAAITFPEITRAALAEESPVWIEGPGDRRTPLGEAPLTVGSTPDCAINLGNSNGGHIGRVRIWRRDGRYMLHSLSRGGQVTVGGKPATWVILEDGDKIVVDGTELAFHDPR